MSQSPPAADIELPAESGGVRDIPEEPEVRVVSQFAPRVPLSQIVQVSRKELWAYYLFWNGDVSTDIGFKLVYVSCISLACY